MTTPDRGAEPQESSMAKRKIRVRSSLLMPVTLVVEVEDDGREIGDSEIVDVRWNHTTRDLIDAAEGQCFEAIDEAIGELMDRRAERGGE